MTIGHIKGYAKTLPRPYTIAIIFKFHVLLRLSAIQQIEGLAEDQTADVV